LLIVREGYRGRIRQILNRCNVPESDLAFDLG